MSEGCDTVQSGSRLIARLREKSGSVFSLVQRNNDNTARIWKIPTVPKIRMFLWRALSGDLAVDDCLVKHGMQASLTCQMCTNDLESIVHVLFGCTMARQIWDRLHITWNPHAQFTIENMLEQLVVMMEADYTLPWLLWSIWKKRLEVFGF